MLSRVLNGRTVVSADMDLRLYAVLGTPPVRWLAMQTERDLWEASHNAKHRPKVKHTKLVQTVA